MIFFHFYYNFSDIKFAGYHMMEKNNANSFLLFFFNLTLKNLGAPDWKCQLEVGDITKINQKNT